MSEQPLANTPSAVEEYNRALRDHGIDPTAEIYAPEPVVPSGTFSPEELCDQKPTTPDAESESLPIRKLSSVLNEGSADYPGYKSFVSADLWHPDLGYIIMNHSYEREDGSTTPLGHWVHDVLPKGGVFRIGRFKTSRGFHIVRPISMRDVKVSATQIEPPF